MYLCVNYQVIIVAFVCESDSDAVKRTTRSSLSMTAVGYGESANQYRRKYESSTEVLFKRVSFSAMDMQIQELLYSN